MAYFYSSTGFITLIFLIIENAAPLEDICAWVSESIQGMETNWRSRFSRPRVAVISWIVQVIQQQPTALIHNIWVETDSEA